MEKKTKKKVSTFEKKLRRVWRFCRPAIVLTVSAVIVFLIARFSVNYVLDNYLMPVDTGDATPIQVVIPSSSSASSIASMLYRAGGEEEPGLITSTAVFKVYVDFVGKANSLKAGTYILSRNMTIKQIVGILCEGNPAKPTIKVTVPEGYAITDMASLLYEKGLIRDNADLLAACNDAERFKSFDFVLFAADAKDSDARDYLLEGYLFPDTYEYFVDATVDTVLTKMLNRFNDIFTDEYRARAQAMGMTMDEVVTLASLIEREAQAEDDFAKVSAVFHNRLQQDMPLQSCASLSYVLKMNKYTFTEAELATESPYNTYKHEGLPAGPICNPGKAALEAALYPNESFVTEEYLYFCNGNPAESNELVFAKTYEEHQANVRQYQQYWS